MIAKQTSTALDDGRNISGVDVQAIAGNPLTAGEIAMSKMFEREAWPDERRRAYVMANIKEPVGDDLTG